MARYLEHCAMVQGPFRKTLLKLLAPYRVNERERNCLVKAHNGQGDSEEASENSENVTSKKDRSEYLPGDIRRPTKLENANFAR